MFSVNDQGLLHQKQVHDLKDYLRIQMSEKNRTGPFLYQKEM